MTPAWRQEMDQRMREVEQALAGIRTDIGYIKSAVGDENATVLSEAKRTNGRLRALESWRDKATGASAAFGFIAAGLSAAVALQTLGMLR